MQIGLDIGVDVASKKVVVACARASFPPHTVPNESRSLRRWLSTVPPGSRLGLEATGRYHQQLADLAAAAGLTVYVLNSWDVKKYADGVGRRGKTDRLDAEVIARYVAREHDQLHAYTPASAASRHLEQLLKRRERLIAMGVALKLSWADVDGVKSGVNDVLRAQRRLLRQVDSLIELAVEALPDVKARAERVRTIPGFGGALSSITVAHALSRLPFTRVDAFIAHTGLDPRPRDSGDLKGKRRLSKRGPAELRRVLHMCAMSASLCPAWRPYYLAQRAKGLSGTAALVILGRKMARVAYGICKRNTTFEAPGIAQIA